jgi:DNA invertase Pin-like site-specific DNA recombinase
MKKAAIYVRVSTPDQHVESQLYDLRELASRRGFEVVHEYEDRGVSGKKARRPGLDALMADGRRRKFSVVLVAAFDRIARSTKNFLQIVDELDSLGIEFISRREGVATGDAMGRLFVTIISAIAELERSLVVERVKSGMRRAKLEGRQIGRARLDVDRQQVVIDRRSGMSLTQVARKHAISRASVCRMVKESNSHPLLAPTPENSHTKLERERMNDNRQTRIGSRPYGDQIGKPFLVVDQNTRRCLVCDELFSRQQACAHSKVGCSRGEMRVPEAVITA